MSFSTVLVEYAFLLTSFNLKNGTTYSKYLTEFFGPENELGPIILTAHIAHHTPAIMSRNGISCDDLGLSADRNILLCLRDY